MKAHAPLLFAGLMFMGMAHAEDSISPDALRKALMANPDIITEVIRANPMLFMETLGQAQQAATLEARKKMAEAEKAELERTMDKPYQVGIQPDDAVQGPANAPITLIEYSDFQCPFCKKGAARVKELQARYPDKVRVVYRHLPLDFHEHAAEAARYFELVKLQDMTKAFAFHDILFNEQGQLGKGRAFLDEAARKAGADMKRLASDAGNADLQNQINARIARHEQEAAQYGISGTPGFLLNGVPIRGAVPVEQFISIIDQLVARGHLKL